MHHPVGKWIREYPWFWMIFIFLDIIATGLGMGVPIFNIALGFFVGYYVGRNLIPKHTTPHILLGRALFYAASTAGVTFLIMSILWLPSLRLLSGTIEDLENFGIPLLLYEPLASFIGWIMLMAVISPFLQFLTTLFGIVLIMTITSKEERYTDNQC